MMVDTPSGGWREVYEWCGVEPPGEGSMYDISHGPKPAEQWTSEQRWDAVDQLGAYDWVPLSPATVESDDRRRSVEARYLWLWTVEASIEAIVRAWPGDGGD